MVKNFTTLYIKNVNKQLFAHHTLYLISNVVFQVSVNRISPCFCNIYNTNMYNIDKNMVRNGKEEKKFIDACVYD